MSDLTGPRLVMSVSWPSAESFAISPYAASQVPTDFDVVSPATDQQGGTGSDAPELTGDASLDGPENYDLDQLLEKLIAFIDQQSEPSDDGSLAGSDPLQAAGARSALQDEPSADSQDMRAPDVGTTYDNSFEGNQRALQDALQRQGATPAETQLALGIQAVESSDGISHDASKDGRTDGARNFSPLNMNEDMLRRNGVEGDLSRLNTPRSPQDWDAVAQSYLQVKRNDSDFLNHLRNGYGGGGDQSGDYQRGLAVQMQTQQEHGLGHRANYHVDHI